MRSIRASTNTWMLWFVWTCKNWKVRQAPTIYVCGGSGHRRGHVALIVGALSMMRACPSLFRGREVPSFLCRTREKKEEVYSHFDGQCNDA
jgi:hypothetical protein